MPLASSGMECEAAHLKKILSAKIPLAL